MLIRTLALSALLVGASAAHAVTILSDNFDADKPGENLTPTGWTVTTDPAKAALGTGVGTVDTLGTGYFAQLCTSAGMTGNCIDLDGSTRNAGILSHTLSLVAGTTYSLTFDLAGSQRNFVESVDVKFGNSFATYVVNPTAKFSTQTLLFAATTTGTFAVSFENAGGDLEGALLDNVTVASIPEPETYALMLAGIGAVGFMSRRRKN